MPPPTKKKNETEYQCIKSGKCFWERRYEYKDIQATYNCFKNEYLLLKQLKNKYTIINSGKFFWYHKYMNIKICKAIFPLPSLTGQINSLKVF